MGNKTSTRKEKTEEKIATADQSLGREEKKRMMSNIERDALNCTKSKHFLETKPIWKKVIKQTGKELWYLMDGDSWFFDVGLLKSVDECYMVTLEKPEVDGFKPADVVKPLWKLFLFNPKDPQTAWKTRMDMFPVQPTLKF